MRSHKVLYLGALLLVAAVPRVASAQFQAPTQEELKMTSDPKAPGAAAVYLYREETDDDPHHFRTVYARIKVLTEKGKELATVSVAYQRNFIFRATGTNSSRSGSSGENHFDAPNINHAGEDIRTDPDSFTGHIQVSAIEGRTIHPDGTVIPLTGTPSDLLMTKNGGDQANQMTFNLPSVEVGSILEYRYQVRYDRFESAPDWQVQQPIFVHKAHYMFTPTEQFLPERNLGNGTGVGNSALMGSHGDMLTDIRHVDILPSGRDVKRDPLGRYYIDFTDVAPIPQEPYAPPLGQQIFQVNFFYTYTPDEKEFWQKEMGYWIKEVDQYTAPTPLIKSTVAEAVSSSDSPLDKAKKLYALVQKLENRDLLGGSTSSADWVPQGSVERVLQRKSGNSREIALLYLSLARTAGLNARPERIASRNRLIFSLQFLNTDQLDSIVIGVALDGKESILDPGEKMAPFQTLHWSHSGAGGVAMGVKGKVETILTPLQDNRDNTTVRVGSLTVTPQGTISGTLKVGFTGQEALQLRQQVLRTDADTVKRQLERMIAAQVPDGIQAHIDRIAGLDDSSKQLVAVVPVSGALADHTGKHLILPRLFFESKETVPFPSEKNRTLPVDMHYPAQEQEQITYLLPAGFALEAAPQDATMKWEENAAYQLRSKTDANSITTARILARGFTLLEAKDYDKLRDFYQKVATTDREQIALSATQTGGR